MVVSLSSEKLEPRKVVKPLFWISPAHRWLGLTWNSRLLTLRAMLRKQRAHPLEEEQVKWYLWRASSLFLTLDMEVWSLFWNVLVVGRGVC